MKALKINKKYFESVINLTKEQEQTLWKDMISGNKKSFEDLYKQYFAPEYQANSNILALTKPEKEYYQRFVNLSVNEVPLPQGDGMIRISPFDDYYLFTLYDEVDGEDKPIDLSNVGSLYLNFIGDTDDIDILNHTQVEEVDLSQGEVLFRITRSDSKKILALSNNNFYKSL